MSKKLPKVAVAGLGVVGEGVALRLAEDPSYELIGVAARDLTKERDAALREISITDDFETLVGIGPDIIVDALPVGGAGADLINRALCAGVSIASANKQAIAGNMQRFHQLSKENHAQFRYSASVGGGVPMIETINAIRGSRDVQELHAIVNGTVNFILTALGDGAEFDAVIADAQRRGFAEPDPTADLSGADAKAKISILSFEAFDREIEANTITPRALDRALAEKIQAEKKQWRQVTRAYPDGDKVAATIDIVCVEDNPFFAGTRNEGNALNILLTNGDAEEVSGLGAGRAPTVDAIFGDLGVISKTL